MSNQPTTAVAVKSETSLTNSSPERDKLLEILNHPKTDWNGFWEKRGGKPDMLPVPVLESHFLPAVDSLTAEIQNSLVPIKANPSHLRQMSECFVGLAAIFPMQDIGDEGFTVKQTILNAIFCEYPLRFMKKACVEFAKKGQWFPRPHELIEIIERETGRARTQIKHLQELKEKCLKN